jgi:CheY-like chemotaxis protein
MKWTASAGLICPINRANYGRSRQTVSSALIFSVEQATNSTMHGRGSSAPPGRSRSGVLPAAMASGASGPPGSNPPGGGPPSGRGVSATPAPSSLTRKPVSFARRSHAPLRALVATSDPERRTAVSKCLQNNGAEVVFASSAGESLYELEALGGVRGLTMVLIDPLLPGCEPGFIAMLRQVPNVGRAPILLFSSLSSQVLEDRMRAIGADGFILTTRGLLQIDTALKSWLERYDAVMAEHAM